MRTINIPIFIPHEGCNNSCVFCNQKTITGTQGKADRDISIEIDNALSTISPDDKVMIAFFGGSFTGLDRSLMTKLCDTAFEYVKKGLVSSIRLSTRPDYIDQSTLDILKSRGVTNIELGIQSMSQKVLDASKRGHTIQDTLNACKLIVDNNFILGGQMMIGLPSSTLEDEIETAKQIVLSGAKEARIYPTVVFKDTELCSLAQTGKYVPLELEEAITRSAKVYAIFKEANINVLRVGLQSSESLSDNSSVYAGPNHPSCGELVMSEYLYQKILLIKDKIVDTIKNTNGKTLFIQCNKSDVSKIIGNKSTNINRINKLFMPYGITKIKVTANENIKCEQLDFKIQ